MSSLPPITKDHISLLHFPESQQELLALLNSFRNVVSLPGEPLGYIDVITHAIHLMPGSRPSYTLSYRVPHSRRFLDEAVRGMLLQDVAEPACSPHNAPLLFVPKKRGDWRVVVDFRKLNATSLGNSNAEFSTLDLQSGFFQVELEETSRPYTAFTTSSGQFMFKRMAQGPCNSPLTFQRLMNSVLSGKNVFFLDDVIIASKSLQDHFHTLSLVLSHFQVAGLKIKLRKCSFLKE